MRSISLQAGLLLAPAFTGLALSLAAAPQAQAACLPTDPSSSCATFVPDTDSTLAGRAGFSGEFTPDVAADPQNAYNRARVQYRFTGTWLTPFNLSGIAISGDGINLLLPFSSLSVTNATGDFDDNKTAWATLNSTVSSLNFANSTISYVIPAGVASPGATIEARIEYLSINGAQQNASGTNSVSTAVSTAVPGPLPLFGAGAAFAASRQLRRRVRAAG